MKTLTLFFLKIKYSFSHDQAVFFICRKFLHFLHSHAPENFLRAAEQTAKQLFSSGLQALYSKPTRFMKRKMHKVQFDIELTLKWKVSVSSVNILITVKCSGFN